MDPNDPDTPRPTTIAILAALHDELATTINRLNLKPTGRDYAANRSSTRVVATVTGIGAQRAVTAAQRVFDQYQPSLAVVLGFAGGLDPRLPPATVLPITWLLCEQGPVIALGDTDPQPAPDTVPSPAVPRIAETDPHRTAEHSLLTLDRIADSAALKQQLFDQYRCAAVDMETYHLAALAARRGVPLAVVRAVTDTADTALSPQATRWINPQGRPRHAAVAWHLATHPRQIGTLLALRRNARLAAARLADHAETLIRRLAQ